MRIVKLFLILFSIFILGCSALEKHSKHRFYRLKIHTGAENARVLRVYGMDDCHGSKY